MKLHNYQQRAVDFMRSTDKCILSIGMGLGKTAAVLHYLDNTKPATVLIVAPKRVAETVWLQEANKWNLGEVAERMIIVSGDKRKRSLALANVEKPYKIIGRDNLADVHGMSFDLLVLDELTSFKNFESKRSEAVYSIRAIQRIGMTGTMLTNGAIDLFGQVCAVGFGSQLTKRQRASEFYRWRAANFVDLLAGAGLQFHKWKLTTPLPELLSGLRKNIFTLDSKDWLDIPEVEYIQHNVELSENEMNEYLRLNTMLNCTLDGEVVSFSENQKFAKLQTLCAGFVYVNESVVRSEYSTKLDEVVEFVERCADESERVLLFYAFVEEKRWLEEKLKERHLKFTDVKDKHFMQKWNDGDVDVLLAHPASAGHGLNLQGGGRICVWSTITYDLELWLQANARLARQGQTRGVQIHSFIARNTVEVKKYQALNQKEKVLTEFIEITK